MIARLPTENQLPLLLSCQCLACGTDCPWTEVGFCHACEVELLSLRLAFNRLHSLTRTLPIETPQFIREFDFLTSIVVEKDSQQAGRSDLNVHSNTAHLSQFETRKGGT